MTRPFAFEGRKRALVADEGIKRLKDVVDTLIVIPNDRLLQVAEKKTSILDAFRTADDVLRQGTQGITDLITVPGLINLDFADVRTIMQDAGSALMGIGVASGDNRAADAAHAAIASPLLESTIEGAQGVLLSIAGGSDLGLFEVNEAAEVVAQAAHPEANIIFGAVIDDAMTDQIRVTVIATGFEGRRKQETMEFGSGRTRPARWRCRASSRCRTRTWTSRRSCGAGAERHEDTPPRTVTAATSRRATRSGLVALRSFRARSVRTRTGPATGHVAGRAHRRWSTAATPEAQPARRRAEAASRAWAARTAATARSRAVGRCGSRQAHAGGAGAPGGGGRRAGPRRRAGGAASRGGRRRAGGARRRRSVATRGAVRQVRPEARAERRRRSVAPAGGAGGAGGAGAPGVGAM